MAYAVLVSLEQTIDKILNQDRYTTSPQEKQLIISLQKHVISLQNFLEDFPERACNLEGRTRDVATAAEDIIEYFMLDQILSPNGPDLRMIEQELNEVVEKIDSVAAEVKEIKKSILSEDSDSSTASSSSRVGKIEEMVGFDDDLMEIKDRLTSGWSKLQFISIVGMGGIGKTTLAKNAYDDQLIQEHFHIRAWVTVSQDYRAREILSSLLDSIKEFDPRRFKHGEEHRAKSSDEFADDESKAESSEEMEERVYKILKGRKYMVVMDDMWSRKVLDDVRMLFPDDDNGSRIMLTTRLSDVATYADSSYEMHLMDENQSWNLFRQKLEIPPALEIIGKEIARSCRGLPLAIVVIAGLLSTASKTPASWGEIAKNVNSAASKDGRLEKILLLSYNHLPHRLRPCLLYMGFFPKDYKIRVSELIKLWLAEGFLKHPEGSKSLEEGAEEYLEDLVRRNLILVIERKSSGKIKSCSLHDMVRDACLRLLQKEKNLRHVTTKFLKTMRNSGMRSVLCFDDTEFEGPLEHVRLLRVLHVPMLKVTLFELLKLFHLRYIAIRCYEDIPSSISHFENLQTLILDEIYGELPPSIWEMQQLRHLIFSGPLPDPYRTASALQSLQTLKHVYDKEYRAFLLTRIPNLRKLGLGYSNLSFNGGRHLSKSLLHLRQLENLKMRNSGSSVYSFLDVVLPSSLKKCTFRGWKLSHRFLRAIGVLPNLEVLKLIDCSLDSRSWVIGGDEFPRLKNLLIKYMEFETLDGEDAYILPRLKCLRLHHCHLTENIISDDIGEIPTLELIEVKDCGRAVYDWAKRIGEEQQNVGNDGLQVRCIGHPIQVRALQHPLNLNPVRSARFEALKIDGFK